MSFPSTVSPEFTPNTRHSCWGLGNLGEDITLCIYLKVRVSEREREKQKEIFHPQVAATAKCWAKWESRASSGSLTWDTGSQALEPSLAAFQAISWELDEKWDSQDLNQPPHGVPVSQMMV